MNEQAIQFLKNLGAVLVFVNIIANIGPGYLVLLLHALETMSMDEAKQICKTILLINAAVIILFSIYYYITGRQDFR